MKEIYGDCSGDCDGWWPIVNKGIQYKAFSKNLISQDSCSSFAGIDTFQDGTSRTGCVWSRSLSTGNVNFACVVGGFFDGVPLGGFSVIGDFGVVSCFCI